MALARIVPADDYAIDHVHHTSADRLLDSLDVCSAGAVILDPPARIGAEDASDGGDELAGRQPIDAMVDYYTPLARSVRRVLRIGGASVFIGDGVAAAAWEIAAHRARLHPGAELTVLWDAPSRRRHKDEIRVPFEPLTTLVRWHVRPGLKYTIRRTEVEVNSNVVVAHRTPFTGRLNSAQRPVELFNYLVTLVSNPHDLIVDPFCGSGAALVAASECDRHWIGADIDEEQVAQANYRIGANLHTPEPLRPLRLWTSRKLISIAG